MLFSRFVFSSCSFAANSNQRSITMLTEEDWSLKNAALSLRSVSVAGFKCAFPFTGIR